MPRPGRLLRTDPDGDIFNFSKLTYIKDVEESKALNTRQGPGVIISASGMAEAGRILHHLKNNIRRSQQYRAHRRLAGPQHFGPPPGGAPAGGQDLRHGIPAGSGSGDLERL